MHPPVPARPSLPDRLPISLLIAAAILAFLPGVVRAAAAAPAPVATDPHCGIELAASPAAVQVGDSVTVTLTYRWPHDWAVDLPRHEPDPAAAFTDEFVTSFPPPQRVSTGEEDRRVFTLVLSAVHSGTWSLPRPTLSVIGPSGRCDMTAPEVIIQVGTEAKPADLPPPRPAWVHPPDAARSGSSLWIYGSAIAAAGALTVLALWRRRAATPPLTPFELFTLDLTSALATGDGKEAGARLSLALRRYAGSQFAFDGPGSTTREALVFLRGRLREAEYRDLVRLLDHLDALRWSPEDLPVSALRASVEAARTWGTQVQGRLDDELRERLARSQRTTPADAAPPGGGIA
jgi:hypothetical protein